MLHRDEQGPPAFAEVSQRLVLRSLRTDAAAEIAELYAPAEAAAMPPDTLMAESEGVPLRIHRAASGWAQALAAESLEATVGRAANGRGGLRAAETEVAGSVAQLQLARERTSLYLVDEPTDPSESEVCPFRGLASFDAAHAEYFFGRERLVADLVARLVGSTLIAVIGPSGSGKSSLIRAGLLSSLAEGVLPGSERWRQGLMRPGEHPVAELARALARLAPGEGQPASVDPLASALEAVRPGGAHRPGSRSARGDLHRLPRRGRAGRLREGDRRDRGRPRPAGPGGARDPGRLLCPLRRVPGALSADELQQRARRADAPRGAAPGDRAPRPPGGAAGRAVAHLGAGRRRRRPDREGCRCSLPPWSSSGRSAAAAPCAAPPTSEAAASTGRWPGSRSALTVG